LTDNFFFTEAKHTTYRSIMIIIGAFS